MTVSIALCTYNGEKYLSEQLNSYLLQTRLPDELIICDDCSTDSTTSILNSFKKRASFSVLINRNEKTLGSTGNFEKAISLCSGDIIFLSDQDDVWMPEKIEEIVVVFEKTPETGLIFSNADLVDENLNSYNISLWDKNFPVSEQHKAEKGRMAEVLLTKNVACGATAAFRANYKNFFSPIPVHLSMIHDGWIAFIAASLSGTQYLPQKLIAYRQHSGQQIGAMGLPAKISKKSRTEICEEALAYYNRRKDELIFIKERLTNFLSTGSGDNGYLQLATNIVREQIDNAIGALQHFEARKMLGSKGIMKIYIVAKEFFTGRYHKFSNGFASALRDMVFSK